MSESLQQLLELYSEGPVSKVHVSDDYQNLLSRYSGNRAFDRERNLIQELRSLVDQQLRDRDSPSKQVEFALRLLRRLDTSEKKEACRTLILMSYARTWEASAREYFKESSSLLIEAVDYFLSFTNRNPGKPNQNEVNRLHRHFIIDSIGRDEYEAADLSERNLVAEAVQYHLRNRQFQGFYYPNHEGDNTVVEKKLRINCIRALAFVQLVQVAVFSNRPGSPNWCFFEYELVRNHDASRILFVQIEDEIRADKIDVGFDEWYRAFAERDAIRLNETRWPGRRAIDGSRREIREKLTKQIERAMNRIYQQIPN
jgi:hypothetical protein